jgi:hypothetical protein
MSRIEHLDGQGVMTYLGVAVLGVAALGLTLYLRMQ